MGKITHFFSTFFTFFTLILLMSSQLYAGNRPTALLSEKEINAIENQAKSLLEQTPIEKEKLFYMYMIAGRELYNYRIDDRALKYYQKAIDLDVDADKSEAYFNIVNIYLQKEGEDKSKEVQEVIESAQKYLKENPKYSSDEKLSFLNSLLKSEKGEESESTLAFYDIFFTERNLARQIRSGEYQKAFAMYNPEGVKQSDIGTKAIFDLVRVLVVGKDVSPESLLCHDSYQRYPNSHSYSMKICGILNEFLEKGEVSSSRLDDLEDFFQNNYRNLRYLHQAAKDLK